MCVWGGGGRCVRVGRGVGVCLSVCGGVVVWGDVGVCMREGCRYVCVFVWGCMCLGCRCV